MPNENNFTKGVNPLLGDKDKMWSARDVQSSEDEVNEFIGALMRLIKPGLVVETGCYLGDGTLEIARALKQNGNGRVISCDTIQERVDEVNKRLMDEGLFPEIGSVICCEGVNLIKSIGGSQIDFAFIDSGPGGKVRLEEINMLLETGLRQLKMFALHDTAPQHEQINAAAKTIQLPNVYFNTPRGLSLFQKI
jgi:predicted O-methyltransferase YrrM